MANPAQLAKAANPPLRDLFKWLGNTRNVADNPWARGMVANEDARNTGGNDNWEFVRTGGGDNGVYEESWRVRPGSQLDQYNQQYGLNTQVNKQNDQYQHNFDASRLPTTKFGGFNDIIPVDQNTRLVNPNMVYDDPHYGRITARQNMARPNAWVGPAIMAALTMGAGGLGMAGIGTANSMMRLGSSALNGKFDPMSIATAALGNIPGMSGITQAMQSPWARVAMMAAQQVGRRRKGGR